MQCTDRARSPGHVASGGLFAFRPPIRKRKQVLTLTLVQTHFVLAGKQSMLFLVLRALTGLPRIGVLPHAVPSQRLLPQESIPLLLTSSRSRPLVLSAVKGAAAAEHGGILEAHDDEERERLLVLLAAMSRKGRWRAALETLEQLEARKGRQLPPSAWHSCLSSCRKHKRKREALQLLARMGESADTAACNEVLHLFRLAKDCESALPIWDAMRRGSPSESPLDSPPDKPPDSALDSTVPTLSALGANSSPDSIPLDQLVSAAAASIPPIQPDLFTFQHVMHMFGGSGRWVEALNALEEMKSLGIEPQSGHTLAALRACTRDRRWKEAGELVEQIPTSHFGANLWLGELAMSVCAEAGLSEVAARIIEGPWPMGRSANVSHYSAWLQAARRSGELPAARSAWAALFASGLPPDEQCYAQYATLILDRIATTTDVAAAEALEAQALELAREAAASLSAERSAVVSTAVYAAALSTGRPSLGREVLGLLEAAGRFDGDFQLRLLLMCAERGDWGQLTAEAGSALRRAEQPGCEWAINGPYLHELFNDVKELAARSATEGVEGAAEASEALARLGALQREESDPEGGGGAVGGEGRARARAPADGDAARDETGQLFTRKYSKSIALVADDEPLDILYEDEDLLVVNKPSGVSMIPRHRFEGGAMVNRVVGYLNGRSPYVVHRLDQPTSGVVLLGKTLVATRSLHKQFQQRKLSKSYLAVLLGDPADDAFSVDVPIGRSIIDSKLSQVVPPLGGASERAGAGLEQTLEQTQVQGKLSLTHFEVIQRAQAGALCEARPVSGRMHQIRVHAEYAGHPLAGDGQYGLEYGGASGARAFSSRLLLHAHTLQIQHPTQLGRGIRFSAPLPDDYLENMERLGFKGVEPNAKVTWLDQGTP